MTAALPTARRREAGSGKPTAREDAVVSRHGKPIVRITRLAEAHPRVCFGVLAGQVRVDDDFDAPMPDEVLAGFEGR